MISILSLFDCINILSSLSFDDIKLTFLVNWIFHPTDFLSLFFFTSHSTPLDNNSKIPGNQTYATDNKLSSLHFEDSDIIKIIRSLDTSKAHGNDDISIRMLKICDSAIIRPLSIIYRNCICQNTFPDMWKKSNICPIHKKGDKQVINNYRPVSLLPICGKVFERLIFNSV